MYDMIDKILRPWIMVSNYSGLPNFYSRKNIKNITIASIKYNHRMHYPWCVELNEFPYQNLYDVQDMNYVTVEGAKGKCDEYLARNGFTFATTEQLNLL